MALIARPAVPGRPTKAATPRRERPRPTMRATGLTGVVVFVILLIEAMLRPVAFFDLWVLHRVQSVNLPGLAPVVRAIEVLTGSTGAVVAWALLLLAVIAARWWVPALALAAIPLVGPINHVVGEILVGRTRPKLAELARTSGHAGERSFPSGHVIGAVMLYGLLFVVARRITFTPLRLAVQTVSLGLIGIVGFARLWEGAHWPSDVFAAYALGAVLLAGLLAVYARFDTAAGPLPLIRSAALPRAEEG